MRIVILSTFLLLTTISCTQETIGFDVVTSDFATKKKEPGVTVSLITGNSKPRVVAVSDSLGRCFFDLNPGADYKLMFSKPGQVKRFALVDLSDINPEDVQGAKCKTSVTMYDKLPRIDYSFLRTQPMTRFYLDSRYQFLVYDTVLAEKTWEAVDNIAAEIDELQQKEVMKADMLFAERKLQKALKSYRKALKICSNAHCADRIREIELILEKQKENG